MWKKCPRDSRISITPQARARPCWLLPAAERVLDKGYDVLFLTDDVDEFALQMMRDYDKKEFRNVSGSDLGLESEDEKKALEEKNEANKPLFDAMKEALGDKVDAVRLSGRLKNHPGLPFQRGGSFHRDGKGIEQHVHAGKGEQSQGAGGERRAPRVRRAGKRRTMPVIKRSWRPTASFCTPRRA